MDEIVEEGDGSASGVEAPRIGVAVGKSHSGFHALKWALEKEIPGGGLVYLLHVKSPLRWIPTPMGSKLPVEQVSNDIVKRFKEERFQETEKLVNQYRKMCDKRKVKAEVCYSENDAVQKELVDQIFKLGIAKLVLGTSTQNALSRALKKETISTFVAKHAPEFCTVMVVNKGKLYSVKDATQSLTLHCSARSSLSAASDVSISVASNTSMSSSRTIEDDLMTRNGIQRGGRNLQHATTLNGRVVQDDVMSPAHSRLLQSASVDFSGSPSEYMFSDSSSNVGFESPPPIYLSRNFSTPTEGRLFESAPATPFHQPRSRLDHRSMQLNNGFQSPASNQVRAVEQRFTYSNDEVHEPATPRMPPGDLGGSTPDALEIISNPYGDAQSPTMSQGTLEVISYPDSDAPLSQISVDAGISNSINSNEGSPVQRSLHAHENVLLGSSMAAANIEGLVTPEIDLLQSQLDQAKLSADRAQREAEQQASGIKQAQEVVVNAMKMLTVHERRRDDALREAQFARQQSSNDARRCDEALAALNAAMRDQEILRQNAAEEARRHQETQSSLEALRRMIDAYTRDADSARQQAAAERRRFEEAFTQLEEVTKEWEVESQLRKEAEEKLEEVTKALEVESQLRKEAEEKLEEVTKALEVESQLRKEAEEKASQEAFAKQEALAAVRKAQQKYSEYSFQELQSATDNFHEENKLGEGGYGPVYKGRLHHTTVAIKILARDGIQGREEFQSEVELLSRIHHPHMVMLLGACPEKACIVYEYMANGSLEDRLTCKDGTPPLPWYVRFRICLEVATALLFLHSRPQPIVHRDLKPGNILLDHNFVSKIGDVGIARLVPNNITFTVTMYKETVPVGTFAYIDPDYQRTGVVSRESDVYALGIVMLQLLTGRPALGVAYLVEEAVDSERFEEILDKSAGEWPLAEALELACISLQCAEPRRKHRPDLETKVLGVLERIQDLADVAAANVACAGTSSPGTIIIPSFFFCPISQEIMDNPYIAADGFTYEHDAIKVWLQGHSTSPMTNLQLNHKNLIPNHSLRSAIREWYDKGLIPD